MNPYLAGFLLGLVLLATIYISGRGLGASGAFKSVVIASVETFAPEHAENTAFYTGFAKDNPGGPWKNFLVFEVIGVIIGGFFSGVIGNRVGLKLEKGPRVTNTLRVVTAILGGALFGFGSQVGRGCTSGATQQDGSSFPGRNSHHGGYFRSRIRIGIFLQKTVA